MNKRIKRKISKALGGSGVYDLHRGGPRNGIAEQGLHIDGDYRNPGNGWRVCIFRCDLGHGWRSNVLVWRGRKVILRVDASHDRHRGDNFARRALAAINVARRLNRRAGPDIRS